MCAALGEFIFSILKGLLPEWDNFNEVEIESELDFLDHPKEMDQPNA